MSFYIYDIIEFDLLIGQPIQRLLLKGQTGKLNICLGKNLQRSIPIIHSLNTESDPCPEIDPMKEIKETSLETLEQPKLEDDVEFFIEEDHPSVTDPLDFLEEPPKPPIELKPLPASLR
jgi:hypothetical protein